MTREEAIKEMREKLPWLTEDTKRLVEALIPEFEESEDERIRKELVAFFKEMRDTWHEIYWHDLQVEGILAWLEKQKDASKAIEAVDRIDKYIDEHLANAHDMKDSNPEKKYYRGWDDALAEMSRILQDVYSNEKQKECVADSSKTSESEEERIRKEIINFLRSPFVNESITDEKVAPWITYLEKQKDLDKMIVVSPEVWDKAINDAYENGKKDDEKQKEQKPAWSEEDERIRSQLIYDVKYHKKEGLFSAKQNKATEALYNGIEKCYDEKINWLKSLPLNLKKENEDVAKLCSNEWSEEDQKTLDCIINVLDRLGFEEYCKSSREQDVEEERFYYKEIQCLKRLKSLKPSWKPSEEQMEALRLSFEDAFDDAGDCYRYRELKSIYEQLKKLM